MSTFEEEVEKYTDFIMLAVKDPKVDTAKTGLFNREDVIKYVEGILDRKLKRILAE